MPLTLIIDDEPQLRRVYANLLEYEGHRVVQAARGKEGLEKAGPDTDLILCDVRLPDISGIELLPELKRRAPRAAVIMLTAFGSIADGVEAMRRGAFDYLTKGDSDSQLLVRVSQALASVSAKGQRHAIRYTFDDLLGEAPAYRRAASMAQAIAPTQAAVLLTGPTGAGKELFAQAIHAASEQKSRSFIALNCAALPRETLESELFGHAKGAYTGAQSDKRGFVEEADHGTLFLDEIGEMPLDLQAKLLRFLETGEYYRLGDTKPRKAQVRLLSATNRDLRQEAEQGRSRPDLYYRLAVIEIPLPGLAERGSADIESLARYFVDQYAHRYGKYVPELSTAQLQSLTGQPWPGNVRELRNTMERIVLLGFEQGLSHTPSLSVSASTTAEVPLDPASLNLAAMERKLISRALDYTHGNKTQAAKILGIGLTTLYRKLEDLGLET